MNQPPVEEVGPGVNKPPVEGVVVGVNQSQVGDRIALEVDQPPVEGKTASAVNLTKHTLTPSASRENSDDYDNYDGEEDRDVNQIGGVRPQQRSVKPAYDNLWTPQQRVVKQEFDDLWEVASHNDWYKWAQYTAKGMTAEGCIVCAGAPTTLPITVPEIYTFAGCAVEQRRKCREGTFVAQENLPRGMLWDAYKYPMCGILCRTLYGSPLGHGIVDQCNGFNCDIRDQCKKFEIATSQREPPTNYKVDENAEY